MKGFIISPNGEEYNNAASKARDDVEAIACKIGIVPIHFYGRMTGNGSRVQWINLALDSALNWIHLISGIETGSMILVQYPMFPLKTAYLVRLLLPKALKKHKFVALIHDLNSLRGLYGKTGQYWDEKILPLFDLVICHNTIMKKYLADHGIPEEKIIVLGIFDYLTNESFQSHNKNDGIAIAGNLSPEKSGYISHLLEKEHGKYPIHLYGKGLEKIPPDVVYHGAFPPEVLPSQMRGAFGLVWDGDSAETCAGPTGEYLRYNNPHKLSLYLASGMPVIIWKEAALAPFVVENQVGIAVSSLHEIRDVVDRLSDSEYQTMKENAVQIGLRLRKGQYLNTALSKVEEKLAACISK